MGIKLKGVCPCMRGIYCAHACMTSTAYMCCLFFSCPPPPCSAPVGLSDWKLQALAADVRVPHNESTRLLGNPAAKQSGSLAKISAWCQDYLLARVLTLQTCMHGRM